MSIAAVQARMVELQGALSAVSQPVTTTASTQPASDFGGVLAAALTSEAATGTSSVASSVASALTGGTTTAATPAAPAGAATPAAPGTGDALVESAKKYLGVPYVWGGESLSEGGLDCSGLVQLAMKDLGVDVPRVARDQMKIGTEVPSIDQARPGDLVVTRGGGHIGIYAGDNTWIHAPTRGEGQARRDDDAAHHHPPRPADGGLMSIAIPTAPAPAPTAPGRPTAARSGNGDAFAASLAAVTGDAEGPHAPEGEPAAPATGESVADEEGAPGAPVPALEIPALPGWTVGTAQESGADGAATALGQELLADSDSTATEPAATAAPAPAAPATAAPVAVPLTGQVPAGQPPAPGENTQPAAGCAACSRSAARCRSCHPRAADRGGRSGDRRTVTDTQPSAGAAPVTPALPPSSPRPPSPPPPSLHPPPCPPSSRRPWPPTSPARRPRRPPWPSRAPSAWTSRRARTAPPAPSSPQRPHPRPRRSSRSARSWPPRCPACARPPRDTTSSTCTSTRRTSDPSRSRPTSASTACASSCTA
ncbi:NlpC/P60 family protein [Georgenia sp. Marseille-Q6866]